MPYILFPASLSFLAQAISDSSRSSSNNNSNNRDVSSNNKSNNNSSNNSNNRDISTNSNNSNNRDISSTIVRDTGRENWDGLGEMRRTWFRPFWFLSKGHQISTNIIILVVSMNGSSDRLWSWGPGFDSRCHKKRNIIYPNLECFERFEQLWFKTELRPILDWFLLHLRFSNESITSSHRFQSEHSSFVSLKRGFQPTYELQRFSSFRWLNARGQWNMSSYRYLDSQTMFI